METSEVLIVGAGPTGLLLANQLGSRGIACVVAELADEPPQASMAIGIMPPSLEILREIGLDQTFVRHGLRVTRGHVHEEGQLLGHLSFDHIPSRYPFVLSLPQRKTIQLLEDSLPRWPQVQIRRGMELVDYRQEEDRVVAAFDTFAGRTEIAARYLVGCDGHRSTVRTLAKIPVNTHRYRPRFAMADYLDKTGMDGEAHLFFSSQGSVESFPMPGNLRRWIVLTTADHGAEDDVSTIRTSS